MEQFIDLTGKKILVVGASSGIGRQTAVTLGALGADLILMSRSKEKLEELASELAQSGGTHSVCVQDVGDLDAIDGCVAQITADHGKLDGLVYSAGVTNDRPLAMFKPAVVEETLRVNLNGFIETVRCTTRKNRFNPGMRIVGVSSSGAFIGKKAHMAYCASKAGMDGAIRCMAKELADKGICINSVAPGMIRTRMYERFLEDNNWDSSANDRLLKRQYLGIGRPEDVANAIAFLISPAARFITGVCLPVDGGYTSN